MTLTMPPLAVDCFYVVDANIPNGDSRRIGKFLKITGISSEIEAIEHKIVRTDTTGTIELEQIPGRTLYTDIVLSHAVTGGGFWEWQDAVKEGKDVRVDLTITVYDASKQIVSRWNVFGAWPKKITVSELGSANSGLLTEEITLAHGGIEFDPGPY